MDELMTIPEEFKNFITAIEKLLDIDDELLTDESMELILDNLKGSFSQETVNQAVNEIIHNLEGQGTTREDAAKSVEAIKQALNEMIYGEHEIIGNKKTLVDTAMQLTYDIFDKAIEKYHMYAIELPMTLAEGATEPTYAHDTDAAADLYALEDTNLNAHTYGNKIRTGVSIQLPEGWLALIMPRSSIGSKTPFRLSNSVGLIDSGYRGELGVLYDNTSDADSFIRKGDRIAQLLVMPSYRFKAKVVDTLEDSDRGTGGFGSTGT